jgi:hypothetical protein
VSARFELVVRYDDGTDAEVVAGQRECAAWERAPFGCSTMAAMDKAPVLFVRYLAFAALKRLRRLPPNDDNRQPTFDQWDATVSDVEDVGADDDDADPTTPDLPQAG